MYYVKAYKLEHDGTNNLWAETQTVDPIEARQAAKQLQMLGAQKDEVGSVMIYTDTELVVKLQY